MRTVRKWKIATLLSGAFLIATNSPAVAGADVVAGAAVGPFLTPGGVFPTQFRVQATNNPVTGIAHGHAFVGIHAPFGEIDAEAEVLCLLVSGKTAAYLGVITASSSPFLIPIGFGTWARVVDNGQGANDPPDEAGAVLMPPPGPAPLCAPPFIPTLPVDQGNLVVHGGS